MRRRGAGGGQRAAGGGSPGRNPGFVVVLVLGVVVVFLLVSLGIGRVLAANGDERGAIEDLVVAEARGDAHRLDRMVGSCAGGCARLAIRLHRPGRPEVVRLDPSTRVALGGVKGPRRVAWHVGRGIVVQCVEVVRRGDVVGGFTSRLVSVSAPIDVNAPCR